MQNKIKTAGPPTYLPALCRSIFIREKTKQGGIMPWTEHTFQSAETFDVLPSTDASYLSLPAGISRFVKKLGATHAQTQTR
jgi:hypothetical protein